MFVIIHLANNIPYKMSRNIYDVSDSRILNPYPQWLACGHYTESSRKICHGHHCITHMNDTQKTKVAALGDNETQIPPPSIPQPSHCTN